MTREGIHFEFSTAGRIIFGRGSVARAAEAAIQFGSHVFLVTGHTSAALEKFIDLLNASGLRITHFAVQGEPTLSVIEGGVSLARENKCNLAIGFGGGSALDAGKSIAALATNPGNILDYLEVIGKGKPLISLPLPFIAIPTTSGTGSEVTRNAVIGSPEHHVKVSLRSAQMIPRLAVIDPELTYSLPPNVTASTGLDALTQLIEPFVSKSHNPITDGFCREGMRRVSRSLLHAYRDSSDARAREDMSLASLFGGIALANAKLGAVHGFAGPIGGMFSAPHGAVCAVLLPHAVRVNVAALKERSDSPIYLERFKEVAKILTGSVNAEIDDGIAWLDALVEDLEIPPLSAYGISADDIPVIIEKAKISSSMKGNPVELTTNEMHTILTDAL